MNLEEYLGFWGAIICSQIWLAAGWSNLYWQSRISNCWLLLAVIVVALAVWSK